MFKKLSDSLKARFGRKDYLSRQLEIVKIFDLFRAQLPSELGSKAEPVSLRGQLLTVRVDNSIVATELRFREAELIAAINQGVGREVLTRIRYRVA